MSQPKVPRRLEIQDEESTLVRTERLLRQVLSVSREEVRIEEGVAKAARRKKRAAKKKGPKRKLKMFRRT